jgi:hypothetical protein
MGHAFLTHVAERALSAALLLAGDYAASLSRAQASIAVLGQSWDDPKNGLVLAATARLHLGQYERVQPLSQDVWVLTAAVRPWWIGLDCFVLGSAALAQNAYEEAEWHCQQGLAVCQDVGKRDGIGWAHALLAYVARTQGQPEGARQHLCQALHIGTEVGAFFAVIHSIPAVALLLADQGEGERAVELYALASVRPFVAHSRWFEDVFGRYIAAATVTLPPEVVSAAQERGRARDLWTTTEELLIELQG